MNLAFKQGSENVLLTKNVSYDQDRCLTAKAFSLSLLLLLALTLRESSTAQDRVTQSAAPRTFLLDAKQLQVSKQRIKAGDKSLTAPWEQLERDAQKALTAAGPFTVTSKGSTPPSGDKHDYMSQAPYFWPDPKKPDGLPYIRRDGERNPEINKITDHSTLDKLEDATETLALAYYLKGEEAYARKAVELLRVFFIDPATKMNPNLQYAQFIPGVNTGRGIGLIETRGLTRVVDAIGLLDGSPALTQKDYLDLRSWFAEFLRWMQESKNGRDESAAKNNHGTYYDVQVTALALFLGKEDLAKSILQTAKQKRITLQIETDGRQPLELVRTKAWGYSVGNLDGLMLLARLGENVGIDLWHFETSDGRSIQKALDFLLPFGLGDKKWEYEQIGGWPPQQIYPLIRRAALKYSDRRYQSALSKVPMLAAKDRGHILSPDFDNRKTKN